MKTASLRSAGVASDFLRLAKKEMPKKTFRLCGGDQRSARWIGGRFLKKATEKLFTRHRRGVLAAPTNQNLKNYIKALKSGDWGHILRILSI